MAANTKYPEPVSVTPRGQRSLQSRHARPPLLPLLPSPGGREGCVLSGPPFVIVDRQPTHRSFSRLTFRAEPRRARDRISADGSSAWLARRLDIFRFHGTFERSLAHTFAVPPD